MPWCPGRIFFDNHDRDAISDFEHVLALGARQRLFPVIVNEIGVTPWAAKDVEEFFREHRR
jgi:hypothetical protein